MMRWTVLVMLLGCGSSGPSAMEVCKQLEAADLGDGCTSKESGGLGAAAAETVAIDIPEPKGKTCQVMRFADAKSYEATVEAFEGARGLAGPHRYGSSKARIFVQCNSEMPKAAGAKVESIVDAL